MTGEPPATTGISGLSSHAPFAAILVAVLASVQAACVSVENVGDGETNVPASPDAGRVVDSGTIHDAGPSGSTDSGMENDAGVADLDAGALPPSVSLTVAGDPNCVLSAAATVSWTGPIASLQIVYSTNGGAPAQTPVTNVAGTASPKTLPVLGLRDSTEYSLRAVAVDYDGGQTTSTSVSLTTLPMPNGVPIYDTVTVDGGQVTPGYTLMDVLPDTSTTPDYISIIDNTGYPVWYLGANPVVGGDFQQQPDSTYTVAQIDSSHSITGLQDTITLYYQYDVLGNQIHVWQAFNADSASPPVDVQATDDHEIRIQPNGDALLFGFDVENNQDLTAYGGLSNATLIGHVLERVTVNDQVTFAWDSLQQVSRATVDPACTNIDSQYVDFSHANAIDVTSDNNYLVSLRNHSQILKLNSANGDTMWKLGGKDGQFTFMSDPLNGFSCQHGARELPNGHIILFDDGDGHSPQQSRAAEYELDTTAMTATLVWSAQPTPAEFTFILGFAQRLSTGNTLIAYGMQHNVQEVDPLGNLVWQVLDPNRDYGTYRAFKVPSLYGPQP